MRATKKKVKICSLKSGQALADGTKLTEYTLLQYPRSSRYGRTADQSAAIRYTDRGGTAKLQQVAVLPALW
jgi:hypothetical protein